jgi:hypothetical protein
MGVAAAELRTQDENINLGDKDSIRRRALLALEGRSELGVFASMEIPQIASPEVQQKPAFSFRMLI